MSKTKKHIAEYRLLKTLINFGIIWQVINPCREFVLLRH
jgi:hypothetical protein